MGQARRLGREVRGGAFACLLLVFCLGASLPVTAHAIGPELVRFGETGSGAGEFDFGEGGAWRRILTGHVFISDSDNNRISEFTAWGEFVKSWGWGVADGATTGLQTCESTCFAGLPGSNPGQLNRPNGVAVSSAGNIYVFERINQRIQVFSPSGQFLRMFGGGVNQTTGEDVCTKADVEAGEACGAGTEGTGPSEFSVGPFSVKGDYIDISADGTVFVGDPNRIQTFDLEGNFVAAIPLPEPGEPASLALDPSSEDIYFAYSYDLRAEGAVYRLSSAGSSSIRWPRSSPPRPVRGPAAPFLPTPRGMFLWARTSSWSRRLHRTGCNPEGFGNRPRWGPSRQLLRGRVELVAVATNEVTAAGASDLYVLHSGGAEDVNFVEVRGVAPDKWPPPVVPPEIISQFASSVGQEQAVVKAQINPNFWADTRYYVEYGTAPCPGGCQAEPAPPGDLLGAGIVKVPVTSGGIALSGLQPNTIYHFRFVAQSSGGGPVVGGDNTFTTFAAPGTPAACPANDAFRVGAGARLADCRAYEMVSPVDKNGGDILALSNQLDLPARLNQADPQGDKLTYSSYRSFGDAQSAGYMTQYLASRSLSGWSSHSISPKREGPTNAGASSLDSQFQAFLDDLSSGWLRQDTAPLLDSTAVPDYTNLYRENIATGDFEALTTATPTNQDPANFIPEIQGFSADGKRSVFGAAGKLTSNASANPVFQVYEAFGGNLKLVSVKPNGSPASVDSYVGSNPGAIGGKGKRERPMPRMRCPKTGRGSTGANPPGAKRSMCGWAGPKPPKSVLARGRSGRRRRTEPSPSTRKGNSSSCSTSAVRPRPPWRTRFRVSSERATIFRGSTSLRPILSPPGPRPALRISSSTKPANRSPSSRRFRRTISESPLASPPRPRWRPAGGCRELRRMGPSRCSCPGRV